MTGTHWTLDNEHCSLQIDKVGGAIVSLLLTNKEVNPLNFILQESSKFHEDFYFKGQFLCLGRWGDPTQGELSRGANKHGEFIRLPWDGVKEENQLYLEVTSVLEGLSLSRKVELSNTSAIIKITDHVSNDHLLGRMYQIVQHPTIGGPFLNNNTIVDCNASAGFDYAFKKYKCAITACWPYVYNPAGLKIKLDKPSTPYSSVFPFIVNPEDEYGWVTAFSPDHNVLLGYIWKRKDYPWINHWLQWEENDPSSGLKDLAPDEAKILYRGLEFGNTGVHKPFDKIISENLFKVLGEPTLNFLDAGETHSRVFYTFIHSPPVDFKGVENIHYLKNSLSIKEKHTNRIIEIPHTFNQNL